MLMHLYSAALCGWDGDTQLHHSRPRSTYTNRSLRVQGPRAMLSNVVEWKHKLFATRSFDFTLLMSILSRFSCEKGKLPVKIVLMSISYSALRPPSTKCSWSWNIDRLRWVHIRLSTKRRIMINKHHCNFRNELQYVTYCIISHPLK